jgi:hypothetical protein
MMLRLKTRLKRSTIEVSAVAKRVMAKVILILTILLILGNITAVPLCAQPEEEEPEETPGIFGFKARYSNSSIIEGGSQLFPLFGLNTLPTDVIAHFHIDQTGLPDTDILAQKTNVTLASLHFGDVALSLGDLFHTEDDVFPDGFTNFSLRLSEWDRDEISELRYSFDLGTIANIAEGIVLNSLMELNISGTSTGGAPFHYRYDFDSMLTHLTPAVPEPSTISIDIKPQSCPNPLNVKSKGVLPAAILGTDDFFVSSIDITTLELNGVAPIRSAFEDVTAPTSFEPCGCQALDPDTYQDLTLKFDRQAIIEAIIAAFGPVENGDEIPLMLTGMLQDGTTEIQGSDCVVIKGKRKDGGVTVTEDKKETKVKTKKSKKKK